MEEERCAPVKTDKKILREALGCLLFRKTDKKIFREALGCLLFLSTRTRPEISAAVAILCRYVSEPMCDH